MSPSIEFASQHALALLNSMGIEHRLDPEFPYLKIKIGHNHSQVRELQHLAPTKRVREFQHHKSAGAVFPALVLDKTTGECVDGNTRRQAFLNLGLESGPVIIANFPTVTLRKQFAGRINQQSGERLTTTEAKQLALLLIEEGYESEQISLDCGTSVKEVESWRNEIEARTKLQGHLTETQEKNLCATHFARLNQIRYGTPVLLEAAKLFADAGLDTKQASKHIATIRKLDSQDDAMAYLDQLRKSPEIKTQIVQRKSGQTKKPVRPSALAAIRLAAASLKKRTVEEYVQEINGSLSDEILAELSFISSLSQKLLQAFGK